MSDDQSRAAIQDVPGYHVGEEIGKGSFAVVYLGTPAQDDRRSVAIKSVARSKLTKKLLENLESEISILKGIRHTHIVSLLDKTENLTQVHLIMEFCPLGDLSVFIKRREKATGPESPAYIRELLAQFPSTRGAGLHQTLVRHFLQQLSAALYFLRSQNLMHRDVKPQNLLLAPPDSSRTISVGLPSLPVLKLADFGFARYLQTSSLAETLCGSPLYMAPEILQYERYDASADLWSAGTVLYEMLIGKPPYRAANHVELLRKIVRSEDVIRFPSDVALPDDLKDLIRSLLKRNPRQRITFDAFFASPVISQPLRDAPVLGASRSAESSIKMIPVNLGSSPAELAFVQREEPGAIALKRSHDAHHRSTDAERTNIRMHADPGTLYGSDQPAVDITASVTLPEDYRSLVNRQETRAPSQPAVPRRQQASRPAQDADRDSDGDYVVVEKKTIELNAFADALSRPASTRTAATARRHAAHKTDDHQAGVSTNAARTSVEGSTDRALLAGTQTGALARALSIASQRLFGSASPPKWLDTVLKNSNRPLLSLYGRSMAVGEMAEILQHADESSSRAETQLVSTVGRIAMRATIVFDFAELKLAQLVTSSSECRGGDASSMLTTEAIVSISQEAILLYLKALQLLHAVIDSVRVWVARQPPGALIGGRLSRLVQWTREKYNEALEKGEALQHKKSSKLEEIAAVQPVEDLTIERLLYDRALDLMRAGALNEMTGEDLIQCEDDYEVAILMLEALLDDSGRGNASDRRDDWPSGDPKEPTTPSELEREDRQLVERWLAMARQRHDKLRLKMESVLARSGYVTGSLAADGVRMQPSHNEAITST